MTGIRKDEEHPVRIAYAPFATFRNALDRLEEHDIPDKVDGSIFPTYSGGAKSQLLAAFRFMGLIDDSGDPADDLEMLVNRRTRKETLKRLVERAYSRIFEQIEISKASPSQLDEAIRSYGVQGTTHRRARRFFLHALEEAGIEVSNHVKAKAGRPSSRSSTGAGNGDKTKRSPKKPGRQSKQSVNTEQADARSLRIRVGAKGFAELIIGFDPFEISTEQRNELLGFVDAYREFDEKWNNEEKEAGE